MKKTVYPDYVRQFRPKGTVVKKINDKFYCYKATSVRVSEKKNPVPKIGSCIGYITETGLVRNNKIILDETDIRVYECGLTDYLLLFQDSFINKTPLTKKRAIELYHSLIVKISPNSYLNEKHDIEDANTLCERYNFSICQQINSIYKMIECLDEKKLEGLKEICLIRSNDKTIKVKPRDEQRELLKELWIDERYNN